MKKIVIGGLFAILFIACGSVETSKCQNCANNGDIDASLSRNLVAEDKNSTEELLVETLFDEQPLPPKSHNPNDTVTIYVHGFSGSGAGKTDKVFGADKYESFMDDIPKFMGIPTINNREDENLSNVFATTTYYGDTPPDYYTDEDKAELDELGNSSNGGIPRYAMIIAKYTKHLMKRTGAKQVNYISGSMGALVTRYLIEKNLENLASDKKIARWLTLEGVVAGNYAASNKALVKIAKEFEHLSVDVKHMSYDWIEDNLAKDRRTASSPYYKDILMGQESSTDDNIKDHALTSFLFLNGQFSPNDGYQLVKDTYFNKVKESSRFKGKMPTHSYFHTNHLGIKKRKGAWAEIATFLTSNKRVKITLTKATINDIHEDIKRIRILGQTIARHDMRPAEIVFSSKVFSPLIKKRWKIEDTISELNFKGAVPEIVKYRRDGDENEVNQVIFDDFVVEDETTLQVDLDVNEIDVDKRYGMYTSRKMEKEQTQSKNFWEIFSRNIDHVGSSSVMVPLEEGTYEFSNEDYAYTLKVELVDYDFPLLGEMKVPDTKLIDTINYLYSTILLREPTTKEQESALAYLKVDPRNRVDEIAKKLLARKDIQALDDETFLERANKALTDNTLIFEEGSRDEVLSQILNSEEHKDFIAFLYGEQGALDENTIKERGELVSYKKIRAKDSTYMHQLYDSLLKKYPNITDKELAGVEAYRIVYTTVDKDNKKINASGLLTVPLVEKAEGLVSDQHGTLFGDKFAPSEHEPLRTTGALISTLQGYVVAMPDYIGYGKTANRYHPYQIKENLAPAVVDMILASKEFIGEQNIAVEDKLFLTGYSEGGYATMAALELLEKEYKDTLPVTAAAPMAGSYDMKATADYVMLGEKEYSTPHLPLFLLYSYNRYYGWNRLDEILQEDIYKDITEFISEKEKGNITATNFPKERNKLYTENFLESYKKGEELELDEALKANSIIDWKPTMPIQLYHCTGDEVVPSFNSQNAYDVFKKNGSSSVTLSLTKGGTHGSCSIPAYLQAFRWFNEL